MVGSVTNNLPGQFSISSANTAGDPQASEAAAKALEQQLGIQLTAEQHDLLKTLFMGSSKDPAVDLEPGDNKSLSQTSGASLSSLGGDTQVAADIYTFMALFQKLAQTMRDTARTQRTGELQAQVAALTSAAEQMEKTAGLRLAATIVSSAFQIAGGMAQMGMSAYSAKQTITGAQQEGQGMKLAGTDAEGSQALITSSKIYTAEGAKYQGYSQASGGIATGLGGLASAGITHAADMSDAQKAKYETQAKQHETEVQHANDMMQQMMDVIRDVRDKLQSIQQAAVETNRGIARNI